MLKKDVVLRTEIRTVINNYIYNNIITKRIKITTINIRFIHQKNKKE